MEIIPNRGTRGVGCTAPSCRPLLAPWAVGKGVCPPDTRLAECALTPSSLNAGPHRRVGKKRSYTMPKQAKTKHAYCEICELVTEWEAAHAVRDGIGKIIYWLHRCAGCGAIGRLDK